MTKPWQLTMLLIAFIAVCVGLYLAIRQWGLVGGLVLAPVAAGAAVLNQGAKLAGAKPMPKNDTGRPRRPGPSGVSPTPQPGEKRARPRRNRGRF